MTDAKSPAMGLSAAAASAAGAVTLYDATGAVVHQLAGHDNGIGMPVRLLQIDTPELGSGECYSRAARTALLALKLAEVAWMKEKTGEWPVILLDEVMAEGNDNQKQQARSLAAQIAA